MQTNAIKLEFGFGVGKDWTQKPLTPAAVHRGLDQIKSAAVKLWGAYTLTPTVGGWTNPAGLLIEEAGYTLTIQTTLKGRRGIRVMVGTVKGALRQEAIAVTTTAVNFQTV